MKKTTLELPDTLVKQVKLRALQDGKKLKDTVAELLRRGLKATSLKEELPRAKITKDKKTGLPLIVCQHPAKPEEEMTPDRIAQILIDQEVEWYVSGR